MRDLRFAGVLLAMCVSSRAAAQEPPARLFPGSINVSAGTLSPSENGNVISSMTVEQGGTAWRSGSLFALGYASVSLRNDTQGYQWNQNTPITIGARLAKTWTFGVLQANAGVSAVRRTGEPMTAGAIGYVSYWSGWRLDQRKSASAIRLAFPGHLWASSGYITPLERGNWVTTASGEQGVTVFSLARIDVVPYTAVTVVRDSKSLTWNNKTIVDAGLKVQRFVPGGVIEAGVARRDERQRIALTSRTAAAFFVNFWLGWDPRHVSTR
jgi:hypothetical protein